MNRADYVRGRTGVVTQMHYARQGILTEEMRFCAEREGVDPEMVRQEVARGRAIIPANIRHTSLQPTVIGKRFRTKINANIGSSPLSARIEEELEKLRTAIRWGADTVMDLSTGGDLDAIRQAIVQHSPVPVGTVPVYQLLTQVRSVEELTEAGFSGHRGASSAAGCRLYDHPRGCATPLYPPHRAAHHGYRQSWRRHYGGVVPCSPQGKPLLYAL
jgi:hypothetical protein